MKTKLKIFKEVALRQSFTQASEHLFISQPAVSKAIKSIEEHYKKTFFIRKGNQIQLTPDGYIFLEYTDKILALYSELENHFSSIENSNKQEFIFGASSTVTQYVLPKIIAKIQKENPEHSFEIINGNTEQIEQLIIKQEIDFGIIEGSNRNIQLQYEPFVKDEIVLVTNVQNMQFKAGVITADDLVNIPMVEREIGSGTREIIYKELSKHNIKKLKSSLILSSTEAIKNYLENSHKHYALLSIHAVYDELKANKLQIIDIEDISFKRWFFFLSRQGFQSKKMEYLKKITKSTYNF